MSTYLRLFDVATPVLASLRSFEVDVTAVTLHWWIPDGSGPDAHVIRTAFVGAAARAAQDLGEVTRDGPGAASYLDRSVVAGATYEYRLRSHSTGGWLSQATRVAVPLATLQLLGTRPHPATLRSLRFAIELGSKEPARFELLDLAGRRVASLGIPGPEPGPRLIEATRAVRAPGVYWARLRQGQRAVSGRVVVIP